ncbi:MAG TPA: hypothetical protein VFA45_00015 [Actinomycetes bacterium]|jgi:hypothetical protein|nr:hypothetical protein [Actinomycetes bacterium]
MREAAARRAALAERMEEERHNFQRDTLLEPQDELQRLARITTRINLREQRTLKERGQLYQLPEGLSDEAYQITISVQRLRTRVLDQTLRQAVADFVGQCSRDSLGLVDMPKDAALVELRRQQAQLVESYIALEGLLGEQLRREFDRRTLAVEAPDDSAPAIVKALNQVQKAEDCRSRIKILDQIRSPRDMRRWASRARRSGVDLA